MRERIFNLGLVFAMMLGFSAANADELPMAARSWGGVVRAAPDDHAQRLASLREGETLTILAHTKVQLNGFEFFKIRYRENRTGYQWGGILCPVGAALKGAFQVCPASGPMPTQK
jgi:hypothetical protein